MPTDEELMRAYVAGDHAAFRALFDRRAPDLLRLVRRHVESDDVARDLVQHTFLRLHAARNDFRDGARLRPWLLTIAMNLVREHWRTRKRRPSTELDESRHAADEPRDEREEARRAAKVREALAELPDGHREVVELHFFQGLPYAEVAAIVGGSEGAVRVRAHRAYKKLAQLLAELGSGS